MTKEVTYTRGAQEVDLNATVGRSIEQQRDQESGQVFEFETRDFLIRSADLIRERDRNSAPGRHDHRRRD